MLRIDVRSASRESRLWFAAVFDGTGPAKVGMATRVRRTTTTKRTDFDFTHNLLYVSRRPGRPRAVRRLREIHRARLVPASGGQAIPPVPNPRTGRIACPPLAVILACLIRFEDILDRIESYKPDFDEELLQKAYIFSAREHRGQVRSSGEPYLIHPINVAYILADMRLDETSIAVGLLHDVLEDTLTTKETLQELFGEQVAELVDGVTKISR